MSSAPIVTVFRSRLRPDAEANGYLELAARMEARARAMRGFRDFKTFVAADDERVSIVVFESLADHEAWRDDPQHREAQRLGRDRFYSEYTISVAELRGSRVFSAK
jgi:heme-degrading monooxygenase HmoA